MQASEATRDGFRIRSADRIVESDISHGPVGYASHQRGTAPADVFTEGRNAFHQPSARRQNVNVHGYNDYMTREYLDQLQRQRQVQMRNSRPGTDNLSNVYFRYYAREQNSRPNARLEGQMDDILRISPINASPRNLLAVSEPPFAPEATPAAAPAANEADRELPIRPGLAEFPNIARQVPSEAGAIRTSSEPTLTTLLEHYARLPISELELAGLEAEILLRRRRSRAPVEVRNPTADDDDDEPGSPMTQAESAHPHVALSRPSSASPLSDTREAALSFGTSAGVEPSSVAVAPQSAITAPIERRRQRLIDRHAVTTGARMQDPILSEEPPPESAMATTDAILGPFQQHPVESLRLRGAAATPQPEPLPEAPTQGTIPPRRMQARDAQVLVMPAAQDDVEALPRITDQETLDALAEILALIPGAPAPGVGWPFERPRETDAHAHVDPASEPPTHADGPAPDADSDADPAASHPSENDAHAEGGALPRPRETDAHAHPRVGNTAPWADVEPVPRATDAHEHPPAPTPVGPWTGVEVKDPNAPASEEELLALAQAMRLALKPAARTGGSTTTTTTLVAGADKAYESSSSSSTTTSSTTRNRKVKEPKSSTTTTTTTVKATTSTTTKKAKAPATTTTTTTTTKAQTQRTAVDAANKYGTRRSRARPIAQDAAEKYAHLK